jgi:hypothetical protein
MNTNKAEHDAQLKITSHLFAGLQLTQSVNAALSQAQIEERFNTIAFADIMRAVLDPEANQETLKYISKNLQARQQMNIALRALSAAHNPAQAAASSNLLTSREAEDFSMKLTFSSRGDGAAYLEITLNEAFELNLDSNTQHLYCLFNEGVYVKKLPDFAFQNTALLLDANDKMIGAFQDHKAEFFIR